MRRFLPAPTLANIESKWFYYEHPEILHMPRLQDALYPRGKQMLAGAERKAQTLAAPDLSQRKRACGSRPSRSSRRCSKAASAW